MLSLKSPALSYRWNWNHISPLHIKLKWLRRLKKNKVISCNPEKRYLIRNVLHTNDSMIVIYGRKTKFSPLAALEMTVNMINVKILKTAFQRQFMKK